MHINPPRQFLTALPGPPPARVPDETGFGHRLSHHCLYARQNDKSSPEYPPTLTHSQCSALTQVLAQCWTPGRGPNACRGAHPTTPRIAVRRVRTKVPARKPRCAPRPFPHPLKQIVQPEDRPAQSEYHVILVPALTRTFFGPVVPSYRVLPMVMWS